MSRRRRRFSGGRLLVVLVVLLLTACSGLPSHTEVTPRLPIQEASPTNHVVVAPDPPSPGLRPEQVVEGFLRAHNGVDDDYAVAREYLAPSAETQWRPEGGMMLLRDGNISARRLSGNKVEVTALAEAQVDGDGRVSQLASERTLRATFDLRRQDGEWRVAKMPQAMGLWLSEDEFLRLYTPRSIYYAASSGAKVLIPDVRWLPGNGLAASLAQAVLEPPPVWLRGVVGSSVPRGTRLQAESVPVTGTDGVAQVALSPEALQMSPLDREALWARMLQTLNQAPGVQGTEITVRGTRLEAPGLGGDSTSAEDLGYELVTPAGGPVIVRDGTSLTWSRDSGRPRQQERQDSFAGMARLPKVDKGWYLLAADARGREIAGISGDRRNLARWVGGALTSRPSFGSRLTRPSYDGQHGLWVAGRALSSSDGGGESASGDAGRSAPASGQPTVWVVNTQAPVQRAQPQAVSTPWLGSTEVEAIAMSPEGSRAALVLSDTTGGGQSRLVVAGVVRGTDGEPVSLTRPLVVNPALYGLRDVRWAGESSLVALGRLRGSPEGPQPLSVPVGGLASPLGGVPAALSVAPSVSSGGTYAVTARNLILLSVGRTWTRFAAGDDLVVPSP